MSRGRDVSAFDRHRTIGIALRSERPHGFTVTK